jgi:enolase-phosphatase E1
MAEIRAIVTDIEGTTSSIAFVKDVLFPYAYEHLPDYIWDNEKDLSGILDDVRSQENNKDLSTNEVIEVLRRYIDEDQKVTPLKTLQGLIWQKGYNEGALHGHIYEDATKGLKRWKKMGIALYVYSSGSTAAQKLLFANTPDGDLTKLFSGYFDTTTGPKKEFLSYEKIAASINVSPDSILFLSDSSDELAAASEAGMHVVLLDRDNTSAGKAPYPVAQSFDDILEDTSVNA